jgi:hypothetical protein
VAISMDVDAIELVERGRISLPDHTAPGGSQPYHFAQKLPFSEVQNYLQDYAVSSERLALEALQSLAGRLQERTYRTVGCGLLMASAQPLPSPREILLRTH